MSRPWKKEWPRVGRSGRKSYQVGFYDHERRERCRSFATSGGVGGAQEWMREYRAAERRGNDSLRRFLLDLDAHEANVDEGRQIGEVIELYFCLDADPEIEGGLARQTFDGYRRIARGHLLGLPMKNHKHEVVGRKSYAVWLASQPASQFNEPDTPREWRERMRQAGQPQSLIKEAWKVLSAILSWAAGSHDVPEVYTNGCLLAGERKTNRRRSVRASENGGARGGRRRLGRVPSWALSPQAVEAIRAWMLNRTSIERAPILAERDAMVVSLQYGLALRNQEVWGMRFADVNEDFAEVMEVVTWGQLSEFGKTAASTGRRCATPGILWRDLCVWRVALRACGHSARDEDFIIPGDLGGSRYGVVDQRTGACHLSRNQCKKWGPKFFKPAVQAVAEQPEFAKIAQASPYSLRRGGISARLRAEDAQTVKRECGTSLRMLDKHYAFEIDDLRRFGPVPLDGVWSDAREQAAAVTEPHPLMLAA